MKKRRLKTKCQKCGSGIVGKICYYHRKRFCRRCFNNRKYETDGRRRRIPGGPRGRPPIKLFKTIFLGFC